MATRDAAKAAVQRISDKFGHLDEEELERLGRFDPALKRKVERSLLAKDELAGHAIITLAQNIYGSNARFVFELLQNADDNKFTNAHTRGALPYVSFHVHPDRIILECNEDGFTEQDLQAICTVGKSSKSASHGYIGAKGIGFKSVFIAAWKVHVQSGHYSFYFKHRKGESGLGMAVPIWQDTESKPPTSMTRMTLYLHDTEGEDHPQNRRDTIFNQLSDLQETSLLFFRNLKKIELSFYDEGKTLKSTRKLQITITNSHRAVLETIECQKTGSEVRSSKHYHVTRHTATGLSQSVSRQVPQTEEARLAASRAEVVLAFPLTEHSEPILEYQELFAFLPVRESHFKFIIQSDFDTSASRQEVTTTSARNRDLLNGIADAFIQAVLEFCDHTDLCYTWPQYLPLKRDGLDAFWSVLRSKICRRISEHRLLMPRHGTQLRRLDTIVRMDQSFMDDLGNPLLDDPTTSHFVSKRYVKEAVSPYLSDYGLQVMNDDLILRLLRIDLEDPDSKMKSRTTSQLWHTIMARTLTPMVTKTQVRALSCLPLRGGVWVSPDSGSVYLPTVSGLQIPQGINLRILDSSAVSNSDRRALYEAFGAAEPPIAVVRKSVSKALQPLLSSINLDESRGQLHFLYMSQLREPRPTRSDHKGFRLLTEDDMKATPTDEDVYLRNNDPYGAQKLLDPGFGAAGMKHLWADEGNHVRNSTVLSTTIQDMSAVSLCKSRLTKSCTLRQTYVPLPTLTKLRERFMEEDEAFPFLQLGATTPSERLLTHWTFLNEAFLVGIDDNIPFLLDILLWIEHANPDPSTISRPERITDLYLTIYAKFMASEDQDSERHMIVEFLEEQTCLFVPTSAHDAAAWTAPQYCLWDAPPSMIRKYSLKHTMEQFLGPGQLSGVSQFFQHVLKVPDASWEEIIGELESMRDKEIDDFDQVSILYRRLANEASDDRKRHGDEIGEWYTTSECLWSSTTDIRGKVTLNDQYEDLKDFFLDIVGVKLLTLQMVYDELLQTDSTTTVAEVKSAVWSLNALLQAERNSPLDVHALVKKKIFPISSPDGTTSLVSIDEAFSIGDREHLTTHFKHRIKMLDYDLFEIRQLATFLEWAGITSRCLSRSVKEMTSANDDKAQAMSVMALDLRYKAHAILRVAASFNSPRYNSDGPALYKNLQGIKTMVTDDISSVLTLSQDGILTTVEKQGNMHIGETDDGVTIYVPRNKRKQKFCFSSPLPTNLAAWLMRNPVTLIEEDVDGEMVTVLSSLISDGPAVVDLILDDKGIAQVPIENEDPRHEEQDEDDIDPDDFVEHDLVNVLVATSLTPVSDHRLSATDDGVVEVVSRQAGATSRRSGGYTPVFTVPHEDHAIREDDHYRELLERVVRAASRARFPSKYMSARGALGSGGSTAMGYNGFESELRYRSSSQFERNFRVGAAGELYVFELLRRLADPTLRGWSRDNWQSSIRNRVSILEDYTGMRGWAAPETSDLVYDDTFGDFTSLLIDHGYLNQSEWRNARPYYYLEVKTTTGPCGNPFYMSKGQYQRMMKIHHEQERREVYIVFRVFEIESEERMAMKVYVDPAQMDLDDQLVFTGENWSVTPGAAS
ncbi:hypothetical protein M409DRAFT_35953 [Zasmidium cellare ATCC 36951]|uniref:Protein NO VEIN C-terminal domain-containing protein n=1 Tax=Zasmidium cellare ATCC 36951 TaxID=1080233 RepID=A0A6A6CX30_ZASCE|nr:uncharacterized protein M409DRAFT_35953 [Zasmidium cellare ATCC 36951]KAF2170402.1 hypothetical protein M409DRAFT_35953 [Zasmidium cellare ATCC 36951]